MNIKGNRPVDSFHRELGKTMWDKCGMARTREGLDEAKATIRRLREEFWNEVSIPGDGRDLNTELEKAGRVADFLEFAEVFAEDAQQREESCGGHFREEHQTEEGEARRDDENFAHATAWEYRGDNEMAAPHKEALTFDYVKLTQRSYK
jgi:succinate dehydrogenase / fumarate reductase flavoprotein subunit